MAPLHLLLQNPSYYEMPLVCKLDGIFDVHSPVNKLKGSFFEFFWSLDEYFNAVFTNTAHNVIKLKVFET